MHPKPDQHVHHEPNPLIMNFPEKLSILQAWDIMNEPLFPGDDTGKLLTVRLYKISGYCLCWLESSAARQSPPLGLSVTRIHWIGFSGRRCGSHGQIVFQHPHICLPLQDWVDDMATYLKSIDENHLVMVASFGYYGASSPASLISQNPTEMVVVQDQDTRLFPVAQICHGEDSSAIASLPNIDLSDMHIYPELWAFCDNRYEPAKSLMICLPITSSNPMYPTP